MIYEVLQKITDDLNIYLKIKLKIKEDKAVLSALVNQDGSIAIQTENKVIISLVNIEKESYSVSSQVIGRQRLALNIYVLFSCYFSNSNYSESIRFLDLIICYFEENYMVQTFSLLDKGKVQIEIETYNIEKSQNLWSTMGAKYLPSAMYKIRMLVVDANTMGMFIPSIGSIRNSTQNPFSPLSSSNIPRTTIDRTPRNTQPNNQPNNQSNTQNTDQTDAQNTEQINKDLDNLDKTVK
jgi:hypothetical protein